MEDDVTGSGGRLGKRPSESGMEVDYKVKAGTAWSHSYLNQKPWHPLSYPNQRRKWIAEQTHANHARRSEEVAREFAQEQEFFRQTSLFSKKEKEKVEMMKAVSFMYVRPPGYDAESAKAAEIADEQKRFGQTNTELNTTEGTSSQIPNSKSSKNQAGDKKPRPKDVFGRTLPTEEEFEVLKNAPRLETGVPGRIKPFGVEIRNVRCVRCGTFGHQSGDRECPLKDVIMPNEESRLKRDDPLTAIMAQTDPSEPSKWELKHKPGMSPPRGGFKLDDPNQQIIPDDIFDEYGGFLGGGDIPLPLSNFTASKSKKHSKRKHKHKHSPSGAYTEHENHYDGGHSMSSDSDVHEDSRKRKSRQASRHHSISLSSDSENDKDNKQQPKSKCKKHEVPPTHDSNKSMKKYSSYSNYDRSDEESKRQPKSKHKRRHSLHPDDKSDKASKHQPRRKNKKEYSSSSDSEGDESKPQPRKKYQKEYSSSSYSERDEKNKQRPRRKHKKEYSSSSDSERDEESKRQPKSRYKKKRSLSSDSENGKENTQQSKSKHQRKHQRHASSYFDPEVDRESRRDSMRNREEHQQEPWSSDAEADRQGRRKSTGKYKRSSHRNLDSSYVHGNYNSDSDHHHLRKHRH